MGVRHVAARIARLTAIAAAAAVAAPAASGLRAGLSARQGPALAGVLEDEAGRPLTNWAVQACTATTCFPAESGADGRFQFNLPIATPVHVLLKTPERLASASVRGAAMVPVTLTTSARVDVGVVFVPTLTGVVPLPPRGAGPRRLAVGDGLDLTLDRDQLTAAPGAVLMGVAARRIPTPRLPRYALPAAEQVVAVYAMHPMAATSEQPVAVRAASGLPAGTRVRFRTLSDVDGSLSAPVPGQATGTHVATDPSAGIRRLTYLVITR